MALMGRRHPPQPCCASKSCRRILVSQFEFVIEQVGDIEISCGSVCSKLGSTPDSGLVETTNWAFLPLLYPGGNRHHRPSKPSSTPVPRYRRSGRPGRRVAPDTPCGKETIAIPILPDARTEQLRIAPGPKELQAIRAHRRHGPRVQCQQSHTARWPPEDSRNGADRSGWTPCHEGIMNIDTSHTTTMGEPFVVPDLAIEKHSSEAVA